MRQPPTERTVRRRSRERATAPAKHAIARTSSTQTKVLSRSSASCAVSRFSPDAIWSDATSGGSRSTASGGRPVPSATCLNSVPRSSVRLPPISPSTRAIERAVRRLVRLPPGVQCGRAAKDARHVAPGHLLQACRGGAGERVQPRRQHLLDLRLDLLAVEEAVDDEPAERDADLLVLEELGARVDPLVGVEQLALGPDADPEADEDQSADGQERGDSCLSHEADCPSAAGERESPDAGDAP